MIETMGERMAHHRTMLRLSSVVLPPEVFAKEVSDAIYKRGDLSVEQIEQIRGAAAAAYLSAQRKERDEENSS